MKTLLGSVARLENIPTVIAIAGGVAVAAMHLLGFGNPASLSAATALVLAAVATSILVERVVSLQRIETSLAEIRGEMSLPAIETFYANRSEQPAFGEYIQGSKDEILAVGACLGYLIGVQLGLLVRKAEEGCRIKLLLMAPTIEGQPNPLVEKVGRATLAPDIGRMIHFSLDRVMDAKRTLPPHTSGRIEVRVHGELLTCILLFLDPRSPAGRIRVELLPYNFDSTDRPGFELRRQAGGRLYELLYSTYSDLWEASTPWEPGSS